MTTRGKAPTHVTYIICAILYLVALLAHFGVINPGGAIGTWAWIIGYGLLLLAIQVRGL